MAVCKRELRRELEASLAEGAMTERFAVLAEEVARLWYSQRSTAGWRYAVDDVIGLFHVKLSRNWQRIKPGKNPFAFLQLMARRCGMDWQRKEDARKRREAGAGLSSEFGVQCSEFRE